MYSLGNSSVAANARDGRKGSNISGYGLAEENARVIIVDVATCMDSHSGVMPTLQPLPMCTFHY